MKKKESALSKLIKVLQSLAREKVMLAMIGLGIGLGQFFYQIIIERANDQPSFYAIELQKDQQIEDLKMQVLNLENNCLRGGNHV